MKARLRWSAGTSSPTSARDHLAPARRPGAGTANASSTSCGWPSETTSASRSWKPSARRPSTRSESVELRDTQWPGRARASRGLRRAAGQGRPLSRPSASAPGGGLDARRRRAPRACGRRASAPATAAASCAAARTRPARARTGRRPTAPRPAARRGGRAAPARNRPSAGARTPSAGPAPTTCGVGEVGDLHRDRAVLLVAGPGGQALPHLALHHHQDAARPAAPARAGASRPAPPRCRAGSTRTPTAPTAPRRAGRRGRRGTRRRSRPGPTARASPAVETLSRSTWASRSSSSSATTSCPASSSASVSEPSPGPISSTGVAGASSGRARRRAARCWGRRGSAGRGSAWGAARARRAARAPSPA